MKKQLLLSIAMVVATLAMAQTPEQEIANRIHYVFAKLNKNEVPTGVLSNYGVQPIDLEYYNGIPADSNYVDLKNFTLLYAGLYTSKINNKISLPTPDAIVQKIETANSSTATPVAFMNYRYNKLREDAVDKGLVKVVNDQIIRIPNTASPYETKTLFAVTPQKVHYNAARVAFVFKPNLKFGNTMKTVRNFQIRFDTSLAYRTVSWNTTIAHTYANSGVKHLRFRVNYTDGTSLESQTNIFVQVPPLITKSSSSRFDKKLKANSKHSGGTLQIELAPSNHSGKIRKALIVAEGFDAMQIMGKDNMDITDFLKEKNEFGSINYYKIHPNLYSELQSNNYDIVYLDYNNGVDDIRRNAALLREAINWVNSHKQGSEPNVVMGISMGGLVARYALSKMEAEGEEHNTWKYISIDSPHKGANVPVGLQAAVQHIASQRLKLFFIKVLKSTWLSNDLDNALDLLNSKAAKQMLIYRVAGSGDNTYDNSEHLAFMEEYEALGFPKKCQNVAVSNGNNRGNTLFSSGATLLDYQDTMSLKWWMEILNNLVGGSLSQLFIFTNHPELLLNVLPGKTQLGVSFFCGFCTGK